MSLRTRLRHTPLVLGTALVSAGLLSMSVTGTLASFTASIQNGANVGGTASLIMQETDSLGSTVCSSVGSGTGAVLGGGSTNSATCSTINKFASAGALLPNGAAAATTIRIKNLGTITPSTFTVSPGSCTVGHLSSATAWGTATDLCSKLQITISQDGTQVYPSSGTATLNDLAAHGAVPLTPVPPSTTTASTFVLSLTLPSAVSGTSLGNEYQALTASLPLTWTFTG